MILKYIFDQSFFGASFDHRSKKIPAAIEIWWVSNFTVFILTSKIGTT